MKNNTMEQELNQLQAPKSHKILIIIIILLSLIVVIFALFLGFSYMTMQSTKMIPRLSIQGIDVSGLTKEQAKQKIEQELKQKIPETIILTKEDTKAEISTQQIEARFDVDGAITEAYQKGRSGTVWQNDLEVLRILFQKEDIKPRVLFNEEELTKQLETISSQLPDTMIQSSFYIEGNNLIITKGKAGNVIDTTSMIEKIRTQLETDQIGEIPMILTTKQPDSINIDAIYAQIKKEPVNAYYTTDPFVVHPHEDGIDFAISLEEAKALIGHGQEETTIPLKVIKPAVTTNMIGTEAFPDLLAEFSTNYNASNKARTTNLRLASNKINGTVIMPGEVFSYNTIVGKRTIAAGYQEAPIYQNGQVVDGLGGGICQISSTLYNAVVYANLEIVERRNHMFIPSYVKASRDATVVYGSTDFKFKNNRNYPIKIICSVSSGVCKFQIFGLKQADDYEVEIQTKITGSIPYTTQYVTGTGKKAGTVVQSGKKGTTSEAYKILKRNGQVIATELLSKDTYKPMNRLIAK